jgi:regulator of replication initiation timing
MKPTMLDLWNRVRTGVEEGFAVLWKGTTDLTLKTMAETDTLRLRLEVRKLKSRLSEAYRHLGERVFTEMERSTGESAGSLESRESFRDWKEEVRRLEDELQRLEQEITDLKMLHLNEKP